MTDSSTCLPSGLVASLGILVLPISAHLPEGDLEGLDDLDPEWVLPEDVEHAELSGANHPFVTEYLEAIEAPGYDAAVVVTPAIEFATMYRNALLAAELATRPVVTIDARTAAAGQALVVLAGAESAATARRSTRSCAPSRMPPVASNSSPRWPPWNRSGAAARFPRRCCTPASSPAAGASSACATGSSSRSARRRPRTTPSSRCAGPLTNTADRGWSAPRSSTPAPRSSPSGSRRCSVGVDFISGFSIAMQVHTGRGVVGAAGLPMSDGVIRCTGSLHAGLRSPVSAHGERRVAVSIEQQGAGTDGRGDRTTALRPRVRASSATPVGPCSAVVSPTAPLITAELPAITAGPEACRCRATPTRADGAAADDRRDPAPVLRIVRLVPLLCAALHRRRRRRREAASRLVVVPPQRGARRQIDPAGPRAKAHSTRSTTRISVISRSPKQVNYSVPATSYSIVVVTMPGYLLDGTPFATHLENGLSSPRPSRRHQSVEDLHRAQQPPVIVSAAPRCARSASSRARRSSGPVTAPKWGWRQVHLHLQLAVEE